MAQPIRRSWDARAPFPGSTPPYHYDPAEDSDDAIVPAVEKQQRRLWRAISWVLLANVFAFWLLTCVTAFAQTADTGNWATVYVYYSPATGSYNYSLNPAAGPGWRSDGGKFRIKADGLAYRGQAVVALNRMTLPGRGRVMLTTDAGEMASLRAQGWQPDGVLGHVGSQEGNGLVPLYRLTHDGLKLDVYSVKPPSRDLLVGRFGWRYTGVIGYVMPAGSAGLPASGNPPSLPSAPVAAGAPAISSFAPASAQAGATVTISGANFSSASVVKFNGVASTGVTVVSASSLKAVVPPSASTGRIIIVTAAGSATSGSDFVVGPTAPATAPAIASFAPASALPGSVVTLTGTGLAAATAVRFNGTAAGAITSASATSLQVTVPALATSGRISLTTPAGSATSSTDFTVIVPPAALDPAYRDAARFLTQATFGPKAAGIERVKAIGPAAWIDEQLARTADSHLAYINAARLRRTDAMGKSYYAEEDSYEAIWQQWLFGQDELRARMSFALSEIMVISNIAPDLEPDAMSSYMDTLNQHAFGNYRDLLGAVTLHPAMGYYLNMLGSEKEDAKNNKFPNENYAREVLQLFSVGLYQLNADGTRKVDGSGAPLATYDESVVKGFARAFTGWTFFGNDPANPKKFDRPEESWTQPMIAFPSKHEPGSKRLLNGVTLPAGQTPQKDLQDALDNIFNHPNVGPFIGRQLIQRFVTSNPSPAYVGRVSAAFDNNGRGARGDLAAVIRAVLLDPDARTAALMNDARFGKQREPVIRFANILRAFNATSVNGRNKIHYLDSADDALGQSPLLSPSVFNFFSPSYTRPGKLAQAGMVAPEFQITNEIQTVGTANFFHELAKREGYGAGDSFLRLDLATAKSLAGNPAALVDYLSGLLTYGDLNATTRQTMVDAVGAVPFNNKDSDRVWRVRTALTLFALSSDFVIQK